MARKRTFGNFFTFKWMITPDIIKIVYVLGLLIVNLCGSLGTVLGIAALVLFGGGLGLDTLMMILAVVGLIIISVIMFFLSNLLWRMFSEQVILFFSIHELLSTLEGEIKDMNRKMLEPGVEEED